MAGPDPKQTIIDYLSEPSVVVSETPGTGGWQQQVSRGGFGADVATIQFLKERSIPRRQVHAVAYVTQEYGDPRRMRSTICVVQDDAGTWHVHGGAGGSDGGDPVRDDPWVNLGGGGWPSAFFAGGRALGSGRDVARVRLLAANGTVLEDTVDAGLVLFVTDRRVELPVQAELYDGAGTLVGQHQVFASSRAYKRPAD